MNRIKMVFFKKKTYKRAICEPYTAALRGGGFMFLETHTMLPLLESAESEPLRHLRLIPMVLYQCSLKMPHSKIIYSTM